jgi:hypothetical protein
MKLSFYDFLRNGEMPPIVFGLTRTEILRLLGTPSSWVSRDDPLFEKPGRDFLGSDSISFGSLALSFDAEDQLESIMLAMALECDWPNGAMHFPSRDTTISEIADAMRWREIRFDDVSATGDGSMLRTSAGVEIIASARASDEGRLVSCHLQRPLSQRGQAARR